MRIDMIQEHLLGQRRALAQAQQFQDLVLLAGQVQRLAVHLDRARVQVHHHLARADHRLAVALGTADDRLDAGDQFIPIKWFGHVIVSPEAKAAQLAFRVVRAGQDQDRRVDAGHADLAQDFHPVHVGQVQVQQDQVVVIELGQVDAFFAHVRPIDVVIGMGQHQFDAARGGRIVLDKKNSHFVKPLGEP
ncbi:hypothetical protein PY32053_01682 [Paracoccus yeei]|uniref:Uncharacterized protein n=1 Tax=Paracoccus yeei TaxID=147645 RepID=A0A386ULV2_9RHOB|nr:hypothetical protein PY32053_01682 [Paracoccus yeei]